MRATQFPMKSFTGNYRPGEIVGNFRPESARSWILYPMRMIRARYQLLFFSKSSCRVSDDLNPYFSERSPELEGDKIIIQAPGRAERSLLRARVTDHGCHPITPPVRSEGDSLRDFPGKQVDGKRQIPGECSKNYVFV